MFMMFSLEQIMQVSVADHQHKGYGMHQSDLKFRVAVRARDGGRYTYQIFTVAGEPRTFQSDDKTNASPREARALLLKKL
jgi:hypothetical protein